MTSAREAGTSIAAPKAWNTRARMRSSTDGASPHAADAIVNTATPATNERRRPTRSVSRPHRMSEAAKTMLYALRTHDSSPIVVSVKDSRIDGKATLTIVASRKARKAPKLATRSTRDGGTRVVATDAIHTSGSEGEPSA